MGEFRPSTWAQPVQDIVKEYEAYDKVHTAPEEIPTKPEEFSKSMVRRGILDPNTGKYGVNSKQLHAIKFVPSKQYMDNHERIFGH